MRKNIESLDTDDGLRLRPGVAPRRQILIKGVLTLLALAAIAVVAWTAVAHRRPRQAPTRRTTSAPTGKVISVPSPAETLSPSPLSPPANQAEPSPASPTASPQPIPPPPQSVPELIQEGLAEAEKLAQAFPRDPDALEVKARVEYLVGKNAVAEQCWQRAVDLDPRYPYAYLGLGQVAAKRAEYEQAVALERKALFLMPQLTDAAHAAADILLKLGRIDEAVKLLEDHVAVRPQSTATYIHLGHAYLAARQYEKAKQAFETALGRHVVSPRAQFGLATALARLGQQQAAAKAAEEYRRLRATETKVLTDQRADVDDIKAMSTDFAVRYGYAARVYLAHGNLAEAARLLRLAARLDPDNVECRIQLAKLCRQAGRLDEALLVCRRLVAISPENPTYHGSLGVILSDLGRFSEAEQAFRQVIRLDPQGAGGYATLAQLYLRFQQKPDDALRLAQRAVELRPTGVTYAVLSQALAATGDPAGAQAAIDRAIHLEPDNSEYRRIRDLLQEKH